MKRAKGYRLGTALSGDRARNVPDPSLQQGQYQYFCSLILYEDSHLLLVYKPAGLPVQSDQSGDCCLLDYGKSYLITHYDKPGNAYLSLPHRLDRPVAGLCILAKTSKAMQRLSRAFQQKQSRKFYLAVVQGRLNCPIGEWQEREQYLRKEAATNKSYICKAAVTGAKLARLRYACVAVGQDYSIVAVQLQTGRHHQIRCQLAAMGYPIQGDLKYGARRSNSDKSISLFAYALQVPLPVQQKQELRQDSRFPYYRKGADGQAFAWHKELACELSSVGSEPAQVGRVLQSVCAPWEWQELSGNSESIWQLCHENPESRAFLQGVFADSGG